MALSAGWRLVDQGNLFGFGAQCTQLRGGALDREAGAVCLAEVSAGQGPEDDRYLEVAGVARRRPRPPLRDVLGHERAGAVGLL